MKRLIPAVGLLAAMTVPAPAEAADPTLPVFDPADFSVSVPNPYFPLEVGKARTLSGGRESRGRKIIEMSAMTVLGEGPVILGVPTITMLDEAFDDGRIVERTFDHYAADEKGNVWYFGEDVTNYRYDDAGALTGTDRKSAWRAGMNDAKPGIVMPAHPTVGLTLFQEHAPIDQAMDYAEVLALDAAVEGPAGKFTGVIKTFEASTADPDLREFKYWARDYGMIRADEELSPARDNPKIVTELRP
jgi:hypothetical protein